MAVNKDDPKFQESLAAESSNGYAKRSQIDMKDKTEKDQYVESVNELEWILENLKKDVKNLPRDKVDSASIMKFKSWANNAKRLAKEIAPPNLLVKSPKETKKERLLNQRKAAGDFSPKSRKRTSLPEREGLDKMIPNHLATIASQFGNNPMHPKWLDVIMIHKDQLQTHLTSWSIQEREQFLDLYDLSVAKYTCGSCNSFERSEIQKGMVYCISK